MIARVFIMISLDFHKKEKWVRFGGHPTTDVEKQKLMYGSESNHSHNGVAIYFAITTIMLAPRLFY